jgi:leucine-rich repeat protein SHOC2
MREHKLKKNIKAATTCQSKIQKLLETGEPELVIQKCKLEMLPTQVIYLRSLTRLRLDHNAIKFFPTELYLLPKLQELDLSDNQLAEIPEDIDKMSALQKLDVSSNRLEDLPLASVWTLPPQL